MVDDRRLSPEEIQKRLVEQERRGKRNRLLFGYPLLATPFAVCIWWAHNATADEFREATIRAAIMAVLTVVLVILVVVIAVATSRHRK